VWMGGMDWHPRVSKIIAIAKNPVIRRMASPLSGR
jgi:hypothetical protein